MSSERLSWNHFQLSQERSFFFLTSFSTDALKVFSLGTFAMFASTKAALSQWLSCIRMSPPGQSSPFFFTLSTSILLAIAFASILRGLSDTPLYSSLLVGVVFFLILNRSFLHMFAPHKCKTSFPIWSLELCDFTIAPMTTRLKYNQHVLGVFLMPSKPTVYYPVYGYCMAFVPRPKKIQ